MLARWKLSSADASASCQMRRRTAASGPRLAASAPRLTARAMRTTSDAPSRATASDTFVIWAVPRTAALLAARSRYPVTTGSVTATLATSFVP